MIQNGIKLTSNEPLKYLRANLIRTFVNTESSWEGCIKPKQLEKIDLDASCFSRCRLQYKNVENSVIRMHI